MLVMLTRGSPRITRRHRIRNVVSRVQFVCCCQSSRRNHPKLKVFKVEMYEVDPEVPFRHANIDVSNLYDGATQDGCRDLLVQCGLIEPDEECKFERTVLMVGRFLPLLSNEATYCWTFSPGMGDEQALVLPIIEDGQIVDLLALHGEDRDVWGCVTGQGKMVGTLKASQPVRIYKAPFQWLLFGCDGVIVLRNDAYSPKRRFTDADGAVHQAAQSSPRLEDASLIYGESLTHVEELIERVFAIPAYDGDIPAFVRNDAGIIFELVERYVEKESVRVGIDTERCDIEDEILERAVDETLQQMKIEGMFA
jgi:hypothetical protein